MKARVHSFESFGTVDGPGVRFVIFFQGCHLQCLYCHNRDLWDHTHGNEYTAQELFTEIKKYRHFFQNGGGVTASGGDPILQAPIIAELFSLCKKAGIHTALDTSGAVTITDSVKALLAVTDLVLLDVKAADSETHKKLVGLDNSLPQKFASYLAQENIPTWIRAVIVPGYTDSEIHCTKLREYLLTLPNVERLELLPFHKMGEYKWEALNEPYVLHDTEPPTADDMQRVLSYFSDLPFHVCTSGK